MAPPARSRRPSRRYRLRAAFAHLLPRAAVALALRLAPRQVARRRSSTSSSRSSAASSARARTCASRPRASVSPRYRQVADDRIDVSPYVADLGELGRLDLMKGASANRARRRAISVLPTPVGPIIRMFFGAISLRSGSATCWRRQRLRRATATARLARCWPTMCLFSSWTIPSESSSGAHRHSSVSIVWLWLV